MMKIGLTGGIGSGKTTVAKIFESLGIPVFYADPEAKKLINTSAEIRAKLTAKFGNDLYDENGLDRKKLAGYIFNQPEHIKFVNSVVHPAVARAFEDWHTVQNAPYVVQEAAILFETGGYQRMDKNILVSAPKKVRLSRVIERDGATENEVLDRMKNQWPDEKKRDLADFIIENDGEKMLVPQVMKVHENLIHTAG